MFPETPHPRAKRVSHKIGYCTNCGWVHDVIEMVRVEEKISDGRNAHTVVLIKPVCRACKAKEQRQGLCTLCGRTECDNLYPVSIEARRFDDEHTCNYYVFLCPTCRKLPHNEVRKKLNVPVLCDTCNDRFRCYTSKEQSPQDSRIQANDEQKFHRNLNSRHFWRR